MHRLYSILFIAGLEIVITTSCTRQSETAKPDKQIPVKILTVGAMSVSSTQNYTGTAEESFGVSLSFSQAGTVERVAVSEGQKVSKGQLLAVLSSGTAQNAYDIAKSMLNQAQDAYDRIKLLHDRGSVTDLQFVDVQTGLEKAKGMEAIARKSLDDTRLYAPFSGVIANRSVEVGANVMPGVAVFKLVSIDEMDVKVSIPENEIGNIRTGQPATIVVTALGDKRYNGTVYRKGVEANVISHTYDIRIRVKNPQQELMPGMVCKVFLTQDASQPRIIVPNQSVQIAPDGSRFVWLAAGDSAQRRAITTGALTDTGITVDSGLTAGDKLIVEGFQKISEGMKVSIKN